MAHKVVCDFCGKEIDYISFQLTHPSCRVEVGMYYCGSALPDLCDECKQKFISFVTMEQSNMNKAISDYIDERRKK